MWIVLIWMNDAVFGFSYPLLSIYYCVDSWRDKILGDYPRSTSETTDRLHSLLLIDPPVPSLLCQLKVLPLWEQSCLPTSPQDDKHHETSHHPVLRSHSVTSKSTHVHALPHPFESLIRVPISKTFVRFHILTFKARSISFILNMERYDPICVCNVLHNFSRERPHLVKVTRC